MKVSSTNRKIGDLIEDLSDDKLKPDPDFQRRLVWSNKDKASFLKTILDGYPFPEIFIAKGKIDTTTAKSVDWLVDGQQRVTTINEYFQGALTKKDLKIISSYEDLSEKEKSYFLQYDVSVRDLGIVNIDEVKEVFKRINATSYNLNAMEINNAFYNGPLKKLADHLATSELFDEKNVFTANDVRRMNDTLFILNVLITCISDYYASNSKVEDYLKNYNNAFPREDEYYSEFSRVLEILKEMNFDKKSRAWNKADLFTLLVEIHRFIFKNNLSLNVQKSSENIVSFYSEVDKASKSVREKGRTSSITLNKAAEYYDSAAQASTSKRNRERRGEIIFELLSE